MKREGGKGTGEEVDPGDTAQRTVRAKAAKAQLDKDVKKLDKMQQDEFVSFYFEQLELHTEGGKINNKTPAERQAFQDKLEHLIVERFIKPSLNSMKAAAEKVLHREEAIDALEVDAVDDDGGEGGK